MTMCSYLPWNWGLGGKSSCCPMTATRRRFPALDRKLSRLAGRLYGECGLIRPDDLPAPFCCGPRADIIETDEAVHIIVNVPGLCEKDLDVTLQDNVVTVKGERADLGDEEGKRTIRSERTHGSFTRSFDLPCGVDSAKLEAVVKNGILTLTVPKTKAGGESIKVKAGK